jgi:2-aminoadipate transaminase
VSGAERNIMVQKSKSTTNWDLALAQRSRESDSGAIAAIMAQTESLNVITFSGGFPSPEIFPSQVIIDLTARVLETNSAAAMQYSPTRGLTSVREAVAEWLGLRGDPTPPVNDLMITSGGMDALGLLAKSYLDPSDTVAVEAPTYLGAIMTFTGYQANVVGIPIDDDGMDVDALADLLESGARPKLLYVIPDYQNPTGLSLSSERREVLVDLCRHFGVLIIEDVAYRELNFSPDRPVTLQSLAPDTVVQVGTFSKIFFPGVRLGWAVGPTPIINAMTSAKQNADQCAGSLGQSLVEEYLRGGYMDQWLPKARTFYERHCRAMLDALESTMPEGVTWTKPKGGFFTWLSAPVGVDTTALAPLAANSGVTYVPGQLFDPDGVRKHQMRLSFSCVSEQQIDEGVQRLSTLLTPCRTSN